MKNSGRFPETVEAVLARLERGLSDLLNERLVGIYVHGSLAMDCFNPESSDIDLLIVVRGTLERSVKRAVLDLFIALSEGAPGKGFEMSVVTLDALQKFEHPTPYELHFGTSHIEDFREGKADLDSALRDPDLAAHFTVTKLRGVALMGEAISEIFPDVPAKCYLDSIAKDSEWSYSNVEKGQNEGTCRVPPYAVLNFCRVIAFLREGLISSKAEGGRWGLERLPADFRPIVSEALNEYLRADSSQEVDANLLKRFAKHAIDIIRAGQAHVRS